MTDTSIRQSEINVNTPQGVVVTRRDYLQEFVDTIDFDAPHDGHYDGNGRWIPAAPKPEPPTPEMPDWLNDAPDNFAAWLNELPSVRQQAENALRMLEAVDIAQFVPVEKWANTPNGGKAYRTRNVDLDVARTVLSMFAERNRATLRISGVEISARCNLSPHTARAALGRLTELFALAEPANPAIKGAPSYTLTQHDVYCVDCHVKDNYYGKVRNSTPDIFSRSLSKLSQDEFDARISVRDVAVAELRTDPSVEPQERQQRLRADRIVRKQYRKRLDAEFDALGRDAERAVEMLEMYGSLRPTELAILMHVSTSSCSRTLRKLRRAGLVEDGSELVTLVDGHELILAIQNGKCTTAGNGRIRIVRFLEARRRYLTSKLASAQDEAEKRYWQNAVDQITAAQLDDPLLDALKPARLAAVDADFERYSAIVDELRETNSPDLDEAAAALAALATAPDNVAELRLGTRTDYERWQRQQAQDRLDAKAALRSIAVDFADVELEDAKRQLAYAGYDDRDTAEILRGAR